MKILNQFFFTCFFFLWAVGILGSFLIFLTFFTAGALDQVFLFLTGVFGSTLLFLVTAGFTGDPHFFLDIFLGVTDLLVTAGFTGDPHLFLDNLLTGVLLFTGVLILIPHWEIGSLLQPFLQALNFDGLNPFFEQHTEFIYNF